MWSGFFYIAIFFWAIVTSYTVLLSIRIFVEAIKSNSLSKGDCAFSGLLWAIVSIVSYAISSIVKAPHPEWKLFSEVLFAAESISTMLASFLIVYGFFSAIMNEVISYFKGLAVKRGKTLDTLERLSQERTTQMEIHIGDRIHDITGNVFNKTWIKDSVISWDSRNRNVATAIGEIARIVGHSNSTEAGAVFTEFLEKVNAEPINKPIARALWERLLVLLPSIATIANTTKSLVDLFS